MQGILRSHHTEECVPPPRPTRGAFVHVAPDGQRVAFSVADNALIAGAQQCGEPTVRINDVKLANGTTLRFEVRFGPKAKGSPTGICQVNLNLSLIHI